MSYIPIPTLPTPPNSIARPGTFVADSDATFGALPGVVDAINANLPLIDAAAQAAPAAIAASHFKGAWSTLVGALAIPASAAHGPDDELYMLLENVADVTAHEPGVSPKWKSLTQHQRGEGGAPVSGSVTLTATSPAVQSIAATAYGVTVTLPDATTCETGVPLFAVANTGGFPLVIRDAVGVLQGFVEPKATAVVALADSTTAAGVWRLSGHRLIGPDAGAYLTATGATSAVDGIRAITLDATRTLLIWKDGAGGTRLEAVVYDQAANAFGAVTLIYATAISGFLATLAAANTVLVVHAHSTAGRAQTLSVIGTTITVNVATTFVLSSNPTAWTHADGDGKDLLQVGAAWVFGYADSGGNQAHFHAITVAGTTPSVGAAASMTGKEDVYCLPIGAGQFMAVAKNGGLSSVYARHMSVVGNVLTPGALATGALACQNLCIRAMGARWVLVGTYSGNTSCSAVLLSVAGTAATFSASVVVASMSNTSAGIVAVHAVGSKAIVVVRDTGAGVHMQCNVLTDTVGTLTAGAAVTSSLGSGYEGTYNAFAGFVASDASSVTVVDASGVRVSTVSISGANATVVNRYCYVAMPSYARYDIDKFSVGAGHRGIAEPWAPGALIGASGTVYALSDYSFASVAFSDGTMRRVDKAAMSPSAPSAAKTARQGQDRMWFFEYDGNAPNTKFRLVRMAAA